MGTAVEIHNSAVWSAASHAVEDSDLRWFIEGSTEYLDDNTITTLTQYAISYKPTLKRISLNALTAITNANAIRNNTGLVELNLPECVLINGDNAITANSALTTVNLPKLISVSGGNALNISGATTLNAPLLETITSSSTTSPFYCTALESLTLDSLHTAYASEQRDFTGNSPTLHTVTFGGISLNISLRNNTVINTLSLPNAQIINALTNCFYGMTALTTISAPNLKTVANGVTNGTSISSGVFRGCTSLRSLSLPSLTFLGSAAFSGCTNLGGPLVDDPNTRGAVDLPELLTLGAHAFNGCSSLTTITLQKLQTINDYAFRNCGSLMHIQLGSEGNPVTSMTSNSLANLTSTADVHVWTVNATEFTTGFSGTVHWERA